MKEKNKYWLLANEKGVEINCKGEQLKDILEAIFTIFEKENDIVMLCWLAWRTQFTIETTCDNPRSHGKIVSE